MPVAVDLPKTETNLFGSSAFQGWGQPPDFSAVSWMYCTPKFDPDGAMLPCPDGADSWDSSAQWLLDCDQPIRGKHDELHM